MKYLFYLLIILLSSCSTKMSNEDNKSTTKEAPDIWEGLSNSAPEETKEWGFALGRWNVTITNHYRNGYRNSGTGTVYTYIDKDSLTIIRRFSVLFNDNSQLNAFDAHIYSSQMTKNGFGQSLISQIISAANLSSSFSFSAYSSSSLFFNSFL